MNISCKGILFFFIFILFFCTKSFSQIITLIFTDPASQYIPNVSLYDSGTNKTFTTGNSGVLKLKSEFYFFSVTHVSFKQRLLALTSVRRDTIIKVPLTPQSTKLSEVIITSQKGNPGKIFETGTYDNPEENIKILYSKLKIGSLIKHPEPLKKLYLNGIKFKLGNVKFKTVNARLEINLYPVENGKVSKYTLNPTPILVALNKLKTHNIISLGQSIEIPEEGFIISFELPAIFNEGKKMSIEFLEDWSSETCVTKVMPNNGMEWEDWPFNDCKPMQFTGKYDRLSINILYHK